MTFFKQTIYQCLPLLVLCIGYKIATAQGVQEVSALHLLALACIMVGFLGAFANTKNLPIVLRVLAIGPCILAATQLFISFQLFSGTQILVGGLFLGVCLFAIATAHKLDTTKRHFYWELWPIASVGLATTLELSGYSAFATAALLLPMAVSLTIARGIDKDAEEAHLEGA